MPGWILTVILMLISGLAGVAIGFVIGAEAPPEEKEWRRKHEQRRKSDSGYR